MPSLGVKKSGGKTTFGTINSSKKGGTPQEFATILAVEAVRLKLNPKIGYVELVAQALGTIEAEGGFDGSLWTSNPPHIGPFAMDPQYYGKPEKLLNKVSASRIALEHWKSDGETWVPGWWKWEQEQSGRTGKALAPKYKAMAAAAVSKAGGISQKELQEIASGAFGDGSIFAQGANAVIGAGEDVVEGVESAEQFLAELAETVLDFRKLGQLAAEAISWFIRLLAKAIWDYVIAPAFHWTERAVSWYWNNFFGSGTETGSGFGAQVRANAGIITIAFWAIGYGVLFTDGESLAPAMAPHNTMVGQAVKGIEGKIARRDLIKPSKVKEKTPDKPKVKESTVSIERAQAFSVGRKRPVSVTSTGGSSSVTPREGNTSGSDQRRPAPAPVARPQRRTEPDGQTKIIIPDGVKKPEQKGSSQKGKLTPKPSGAGMGPRGTSGTSA